MARPIVLALLLLVPALAASAAASSDNAQAASSAASAASAASFGLKRRALTTAAEGQPQVYASAAHVRGGRMELLRSAPRRSLGASTQEEQSARHVEAASGSSRRELAGPIAKARGTENTRNGAVKKITTSTPKKVYDTREDRAYHNKMVAKWNKANGNTRIDRVQRTTGNAAKGTVKVVTKGVGSVVKVFVKPSKP